MKIFIALAFLISYIQASNLLTHNIYERTDRVDIMLSFDTPYEGTIFQKTEESGVTLTINDLSYDKVVEKNINSSIVQEFAMKPEKNSIKIFLKSDKPIAVIASKTVDGFGLRIRSKTISESPTKTQNTKNTTTNNSPSTLEDSSLVDYRYILVIVFLTIMIGVMFWIRKNIGQYNTSKISKGSWLFPPEKKSTIPNEVVLLHKKPIDANNSVVLFEFAGVRYLVVTGNSNLLLEKFKNGEIKDESDFEKVFEDNRRKLDDYLKLQDARTTPQRTKSSQDYITKLESY
ncbi:MAG: hypothetical protein PHN38_01355 [Sulfurospirillaceae bacterium]|nr:hypothetical protein [Sulfurospirillaceae bacterium]MDD3462418.1 hypothetical protein [Sulfurospirillaceae bacterium]